MVKNIFFDYMLRCAGEELRIFSISIKKIYLIELVLNESQGLKTTQLPAMKFTSVKCFFFVFPCF